MGYSRGKQYTQHESLRRALSRDGFSQSSKLSRFLLDVFVGGLKFSPDELERRGICDGTEKGWREWKAKTVSLGWLKRKSWGAFGVGPRLEKYVDQEKIYSDEYELTVEQENGVYLAVIKALVARYDPPYTEEKFKDLVLESRSLK